MKTVEQTNTWTPKHKPSGGNYTKLTFICEKFCSLFIIQGKNKISVQLNQRVKTATLCDNLDHSVQSIRLMATVVSC